MNPLLDQMKKQFAETDEESRYVYADGFVNASVAAQIKVNREAQKLSQQDLADKVGTKQSGISRLESIDYDAWKVESLRKIARALGLWLDIEFREFGDLPDRIAGFTQEHLKRRRFDKDPAFQSTQGYIRKKRRVRSGGKSQKPIRFMRHAVKVADDRPTPKPAAMAGFPQRQQLPQAVGSPKFGYSMPWGNNATGAMDLIPSGSTGTLLPNGNNADQYSRDEGSR